MPTEQHGSDAAPLPSLPQPASPWVRVMTAAMVGGALLHIMLVAWVVWNRIDYPYELEWIEGSGADTVQRVLEGKPIYVAPSLEFTPYLYTPMYFWLSALCAQFTGMSLLPLRVVSVLATAGCLALVFLFVRRETRSSFCAFLAAGLYAGCFKSSGYWFDVGRVDSLFIFFTMASIYALRGARGAGALSWAAVLMTLAFLTKQSALFLAAPLALYSILALEGRSRLIFPGVLAGLIGVSVAALSLLSDGWFFYYVFDMPRGHAWARPHIVGFWAQDILRDLPIAAGVGVFWLMRSAADNRPRDRSFYPLLAVGMFGCAWVSRLHAGSAPNVVMPAYLTISLLFGLGLHRSLDPRFGGQSRLLVMVLCALQYTLPIYDPRPQIPTAADRATGDAYIEVLRQIDGDVFVSHPAFLTTLAGKPSYSDGASTGDIFRGADADRADRLKAQVVETLRSKRYAAVVTSQPWLGLFLNSPEYLAELQKHYEDRGPILPDDGSFMPVTGLRVARPDRLFVRKP